MRLLQIIATSNIIITFVKLVYVGVEAFSFGLTSREIEASRFQKEIGDRYSSRFCRKAFCLSLTSSASASNEVILDGDLGQSIEKSLAVLYKAAETKNVDSDEVYRALVDLEKLTRQLAKEDPTFAQSIVDNLDGDWRLIFTTGTAQTQKKIGGGRINYFPLKAVQSFRTKDIEPKSIENGIYFGTFPAIKFKGTMEFDLRKRRLEFDFDSVMLLDTFDIKLRRGEAATLGAKSGLGSESNVKNIEQNNKKAFFNWISADDKIATARGGGGGLALWKRVC